MHYGAVAWFFRHLFCNCDTAELRDQLLTLQGKVTTLSRQVADAEDYVERLSGRVLKRLDRAKVQTEEPDSNGMDPISAAIHKRRNRGILPSR